MRAFILTVFLLTWSGGVVWLTFISVRDKYEHRPIRCKSPIEPKLEILVDGDKLDTTWVYVRNIER